MAELITREKHPGRVAQDHKFAALMKKRKEEILRNKEQSTVQSTVQSTEQPSVQSTEQPSAQSKVQSFDTHVYGVGMFVYSLHITFPRKIKNSSMKNKINHQNALDLIYNK